MENISFEEALNRLEIVVKELEDGQLPLEKALALFEEGMWLSKFCYQQLEKAETRILELMTDENKGMVLKETNLNFKVNS